MLSHPAFIAIDLSGCGLSVRGPDACAYIRSTKTTAKKTTVTTV